MPIVGSANVASTAVSVRFGVVADDTMIVSDEWLTLPDIAERLELRITAVHQLIRDGGLLATRIDGIRKVPIELVSTDVRVAKHIKGVITVLRDAGFSDDEALRWLFTPDELLGATPARSLHGHKATEVKRRAQALAF